MTGARKSQRPREDAVSHSKRLPGRGKGRDSPPRKRMGDFVLEQCLGRGGMGVIYQATQLSLQRKVALKILPRSFAADKNFCARFLVEARAVAQLSHQNIIQIYVVGKDQETGNLYLAMELIQGRPLEELIKEKTLSFGDIIHIAMSVARGLAHAWERGIIHRDVKPTNVMIGPKNRVTLLDFGLAKLGSLNIKLTRADSVVGTPEYISPEQAAGLELDCRTDLYSLGVLIYQMLGGDKPFAAPSVAGMFQLHSHAPIRSLCAARPNIPPEFEEIVGRLLAKNPEKRYSNPSHVFNHLKILAIHLRDRGILEHRPDGPSVQPVTVDDQKSGEFGPLLDISGSRRFSLRGSGHSGPDHEPAPPPAQAAPDRRNPWRLVSLGLLLLCVLLALGDSLLWPEMLKLWQGNARSDAPPGLDTLQWQAATPLEGAVPFEEVDGAAWRFNREGDGQTEILGMARAKLRSSVGAGPWRVEGMLIPYGAEEFGMFVEVAGRRAAGVVYRRFGDQQLCSVDRFESREGTRIRVSEGLHAAASCQLTLSVCDDRLRIELDSGLLCELKLDGLVTGLSLYVDTPRGQAGFRNLTLQRPLP